MPLRLTRKTPGWDGAILGGNTVTLRLPMGMTYHQVHTTYAFSDGCCALALAAAVDQIRVVANGRPIWQITAAELDLMNQYDGRQAAADAGGILTVDFDRFNLRQRSNEEFTSLGTGLPPNDANPVRLTTLTLEFDLKAAVASGSLSSHMRVSDARHLGLFRKLRRFVDTYGGAGDFDKSDYPKGDLINRAFFYESANDIDRLRIERDDYVVFDRTKELNSAIQIDGVRTPQTNLFVYDTTEDGNGSDSLVTRNVNDLKFTFTLGGAMTMTTVMDYIGAMER